MSAPEERKKGAKKRPYGPPTIRTERLYERKSLACGKASRRTFGCLANLRQS